MKKDGPVNFGALEEICDAAILYIVSTVYTRKAGLSSQQGRPKAEISHQRTNFRKSDHFVVTCPDLSFKKIFLKCMDEHNDTIPG